MSLVAFDFDGTISDSEMIVELGTRQGVAADIDAITERAMNGEIDYADSLRQRAALLEGLPETEVVRAFEETTLRPGTASLFEALQSDGIDIAVFSGGFERGVEAALESAGLSVDTVAANRLPVSDGVLTGDVEGPHVEGTKDETLRQFSAEKAVALEETVTVGDGANDVPMFEISGYAVGFDPKPAVESECDEAVESMAELRSVFVSQGLLSKATQESNSPASQN